MSEVQSRPAPRGRSSARGGRGGHGARGPRSSKQTNGDEASTLDTSADQGELLELKRKYRSQLATAKELFPDWTDLDLLLAIEESAGDLEVAIGNISEGNVSQFSEVKKTKDRSRSKVKEASTGATDAPTSRGSRAPARGGDSARGGRGRGTERGRGGFRGAARGGTTNGTRSNAVASGAPAAAPDAANAWDTVPSTEDKDNAPAAAVEPPSANAPFEAPKPAPVPAVPQAKKTWASMFATPKPAPAPPKPAVEPPAPHEEPSLAPAETPPHELAQEAVVEAEELPIPPVADELPEEPQVELLEDPATLTPEKPQDDLAPEVELTPSRDELTTDNVEHLPDVSHPPPTETAASTVASSRDIGVATPLSASGQQSIGRPGIGGYATTALKATGGSHRSASFQRRLVEQQEAVVMPGNHAVDRAAVQFGSLGLNGDLDADTLDVDEDREEAETRTQPPQHSPVAQPRAALPPAPRQAPPAAETQPLPQETTSTPKQAPGLPPVPQQQQQQQQQQPLSQSPSNPLGPQAMQSQGSQGAQQYNQFSRYGQSGIQPEAAAPPQKSYDPFGQQAPQPSQLDYANQQQNQTQAQQQPQQQQQPQSQTGAFSSAPDSFASQYFTSDQQRLAYQNYYQQNYNQQSTPSQQEAGSTQQRTGSAFGTGPSDTAFPPSQQQQSTSRYNDAQNSGHTTPNPALGGQHPSGPASQGQHMHQPHAQPGQHTGGYPYNHPYYGSPYYANYMNQFGNYGQGGYGGFGQGKGMYGQPHHYGMSPQTSFDQHSSSPANVGGFGGSSMHGRESGLGGGLGDYGRSASGTSQNQHGATAGAGFGAIPDVFSRSQGGYPNQSSSYGQQQAGQQGAEDSLKPFGDSKSGGPSPSALGAQPGRPGSATNNAPGQSAQGGLPPQSHQQGFGGYPSHLQGGQQGNQYGGLGGLGHQGAGSHQQAGGYGGGYGGFGGAGGYGSYNRGGWGTNYGQH
ncbi:hypothetical protein BCR34DRAFT_592979 [Clohesyomyces aquaticus]|uniref:RNA polymerase II degradation factor 1 n=1 Tax=Clohesyomyces aquaticus TaxID=1231657 RepID=A0A1Y1YMJ3_9PLEO|nr:hypothetical protein BCR34DRAFT_592979 [Clohesyomyces aquaticus]